MPPQPSGNGTQFAGDATTQLLAPVGKGRVLLPVYEPGRAPVDLDGRFLLREYQLPDPTAVIPVTPAQPQPITNGEPYNDHPWCRKRLVAIAVIFGSGMVVGALIATIRWWFG